MEQPFQHPLHILWMSTSRPDICSTIFTENLVLLIVDIYDERAFVESARREGRRASRHASKRAQLRTVGSAKQGFLRALTMGAPPLDRESNEEGEEGHGAAKETRA